VQHVLVQQVPDERIDRHARRDGSERLPRTGRSQREDDHAQRRQAEVGHDRVMLEIGHHELPEGHPVEIVGAFPERQIGLIHRIDNLGHRAQSCFL
jgi:hypothetical protein